MSRTLHVDLTPSRRSRRLLQNGYYLQPPGEQAPVPEYSSEDDDDNASVHSNNSSIFSERAVHYRESPGTVFSHSRRRRKGMESPRVGTLLVQSKSHSPVVKKKTKHVEASTSSRSTPNVSSVVSRQEKLSVTANHTSTSRETKTTIHSVKQTSHRYARGEASSVTQSSLTAASQSASRNVTLNTSSNQAERHETTMTRNQSRYNAIGSGDQAAIQSSRQNEIARPQAYSTPRVPEARGDTSGASQSHNNTRQRTLRSQYSSESSFDNEENVIPSYKNKNVDFTVPMILTKVSDALWVFITWLASCFGQVCRTIYQTTLSIFVFDVWWLSRRTSPLFVKIARYLLLFLLLLLLLTSVYLFATRLIGDNAESVLFPVQTMAGILHTISQKFTSSKNVFSASGTKEKIIYKPDKVQAQYLESHPDLEALMMKTDLRITDRLMEVKNEILAIQKEQSEFNQKHQDIQLQITETKERQEATDLEITKKLMALENEISAMKITHTKTGQDFKADIEQLRGLLADKSQMSVKISEFNTRLSTFDARLNTLNDLMMKSIKDVDQHVGNTTYVKEIAKMQFIENFLQILKSTERSTEDKNGLNFLFVAWLRKQGFAQVEEVDRDMKHLAVSHNLTIAVLEKKFLTQFERVRHEANRHSQTITLEKIVERPVIQEAPAVQIGAEAEMRKWIQEELAIYSADRIGLADHALESAGGYVVSTRCSESYDKKSALISLFGMPIYYNINTPRSVIQASTLPGECWSFKGAEGYIVIALSGAVLPTSFTIEHIPRELSPYGRIDSAPKDFSVLGLADSYDYEGKVLGKYRYERDGPVIQQFAVIAENPDYFSYIELRVSSNWGHPDYTCLYRFRVHGNRQDSKTPPL